MTGGARTGIRGRLLGGPAAVLLVVVAVAGCGSPASTAKAPAPIPPTATVSGSTSGSASGSTSAVDGFKSPRNFTAVAEPTRIRIPSAGIDSKLGRVGLAADGTIDAPKLWQQAAWYDRGPRPGQEGPAVIVGHVDSKSGAAVFFRLGDLHPGAKILLSRADGSTETFRMTQRDQFPKAGFPAGKVYSPTLKPSLLLITCGGTFDAHTGHYRDNVVVTAVPA